MAEEPDAPHPATHGCARLCFVALAALDLLALALGYVFARTPDSGDVGANGWLALLIQVPAVVLGLVLLCVWLVWWGATHREVE